MAISILMRPIVSITYGQGDIWKPVPKPKEAYNASKEWLKQSNTATALIDFLEKDDLKVHVLICTTASMPNKFWIPDEVALLQFDPFIKFGVDDVLVTWNPETTWHVHAMKKDRPIGRWSEKSSMNRFQQDVRSEIIMIHEFGHVRQWVLKHDWYYGKWKAAVAGNNQANLDIEHDNLLTVESVVAKETGQGVRWVYANNC